MLPYLLPLRGGTGGSCTRVGQALVAHGAGATSGISGWSSDTRAASAGQAAPSFLGTKEEQEEQGGAPEAHTARPQQHVSPCHLLGAAATGAAAPPHHHLIQKQQRSFHSSLIAHGLTSPNRSPFTNTLVQQPHQRQQQRPLFNSSFLPHGLPSTKHSPLTNSLVQSQQPHQQQLPQQQQQQRSFFNSSFMPYGLTSRDRVLTNALIVANVLVYVISTNDPHMFHDFAQINSLVVGRGEYYRVVSAAFLHGGLLHLLSNCLSLHWIAPSVERDVGRPAFATIFLASVIGGGAMHLAMGPFFGALVGASGGAAGLLAAQLAYKYRNRAFVPFTSDDISWIGQLVAINVVIAMLSHNISHWGHLGGALGGAAAMLLIGPRFVWGPSGVENRPLLPLFRAGARRSW